jgi:CRP-like cAMP-binding protein
MSGPLDDVDLVRRTIARYVPLTDTEWNVVRPSWRERRFAKGAMVTREGEVEHWFSIVQEGVQRLHIPHDGEQVCVGFAFAYGHGWSGMLDSFVTRLPARSGVQAVTDSVLLSIHHDDLRELRDRLPLLERFGRLILEELVVGRATREIEQLSFTAEERYRALLQRSPHLLQLMPQRYIDGYLRMTPRDLQPPARHGALTAVLDPGQGHGPGVAVTFSPWTPKPLSATCGTTWPTTCAAGAPFESCPGASSSAGRVPGAGACSRCAST